MRVDQHIGTGTLKKGKNEVLIKVCQNEQTEQWAQLWTFQVALDRCRGPGRADHATEERVTRSFIMLQSIRFVHIAIVGLLVMPVGAAEWPQFRGPGGASSSAEKNLPVAWSRTRRAPLEGGTAGADFPIRSPRTGSCF